MLRRLHAEQPADFSFTEANLAWAEGQISKYPDGRQASAVIPLLWRAQEQEGWLSRPAIEEVGRMLDMAYIRVLEVATFYFMFQLQPVGSVAHIQVCGTTSCMICGAEDLVAVCRSRIAKSAHALSGDGKFSWEEVECLGACANAPMVQIGKDYYEDLTAARLEEILDEMAAGRVPVPGPQNGRYAAEPKSGLTSLTAHAEGRPEHNASAALATEIGDTIKRIDGTEVPLVTPWRHVGDTPSDAEVKRLRETSQTPNGPEPSAQAPADDTGVTKQEAREKEMARPDEGSVAPASETAAKPGDATPGQSVASAEADPDGRRETAAPGSEADGTPADGASPREPDSASTHEAAGAGPDSIADEDTRRPAALDAPRDGQADDLKRIKGVGPKLEEVLHDLGYYHFDQIAGWSAAEIAWVDRNLDGFKGRVVRDEWVAQAARLASGETEV